MQKIKIKIYIKNRIRPIVVVDVPDIKDFDDLHTILDSADEVVKFGQIIFNKSEFRYAVLILK